MPIKTNIKEKIKGVVKSTPFLRNYSASASSLLFWFVEVNYPDQYYMQTIEGNTSSGYSGSQSNGGGVYRRTRSYSSIIGVIRPYEDSTPQPQEPTE